MNNDDNLSEEKTEVIYGAENIINLTLEKLSIINHFSDICADHNGPSMFVIPNHPITKVCSQLKDRGIKLRFISEITKDNIQYCKELMKVCELRHLDEIKGNFGLGDGLYYTASAKSTESSPPPLLILSTLRAFVEQQQYFFDMLWKKAIPAKRRISEIEEGLKREFIETIQDPKEMLQLVPKIISMALDEILIIFSNVKTFEILENEIKIDHLLRDQAKNGVNIRILINRNVVKDKSNINKENNILDLVIDYPQYIQIQNLKSGIHNRLTTIIADRELSLTIETKHQPENIIKRHDNGYEVDKYGTMGLSSYSNSESTVMSFAIIFESLWIKSELFSYN